jgi:hypothetical protein
MQVEIVANVITRKVYWVADNNLRKHICHDPIYAQWLEDKFSREAKEMEKKSTSPD